MDTVTSTSCKSILTLPYLYTKSRRKNKSYLLLLPNLSCNFGLWREFLLFLPYVTIILPPKKTTIGQNPLWSQIELFSYSFLLQLPYFQQIVSEETFGFENCRKFKQLSKIQTVIENFNFLPSKLNFCCEKYSREEIFKSGYYLRKYGIFSKQ